MSVNISTRVSENNLDASAEKLDEYLVKIANGDREALAAIHQATSDSVCGYALSILKKPHDAQDVKQRTDITFLFPLYILRLVCNLLAEPEVL